MDPPVDDVETILISGPSLSGRRRLLYQLLCDSSDRPVVVATRQTADTVRSTRRHLTDEDGTDPIVIDCVTNALGRSVTDTSTTKYADHPSNLTSIGLKFTSVIDQHEMEDVFVGLTNISPLLIYSSPSDVFRFTNVLVQQAIGSGWSVMAAIDPSTHDEATVEQFLPLFDCLIETRRTDDGQEYRVRKPTQTAWTAF